MKTNRKTTQAASASKAAKTKARAVPKPSSMQIGNILDRISDGFVAFDAQMNYTYVNPKGGELLGRKPEDLIGKNYWVEYPEAKSTPFADAYVRALKTQTPIVIEDYYAPFDRWFENRIYPSSDGLTIFFTDITEPKKAEQALLERERLITAIAETTPALIYVYDMETQSNVYSNAGIVEALGYTPKEVQAMGEQVFARLIHPDDLSTVMKFQARVMTIADGETLEIEYRMKDSTGSWRHLHSYERAFLRNADGSLKQKLGVAMDVTGRKRAELALRESEEKYSSLFHKGPYPAALAKLPEGIFADVNEEFVKTFGYSRAEALGKTSLELGLYPNPEERKRSADSVNAQGFVRNAEIKLRTKAGELRDFLVSTDLLEFGGEKYVLTTAKDITERKQAEKQTRLSEERFSKAFHASPAGMTITRIADGKFIDVNESFCRMFEFSREEALGHTSTELNMWTPEERKKLIDEQIRSGGLHDFELQARSKSGRAAFILFSSKPMELEGEPCLITTMIDITERKRAQEELQRGERVLRLFVEHSPAAIAMFDREMKYIVASNRYLIDYELGEQNVVGRSHYEVFPEIPERWKEIHRRCLAGAIERNEEDPFPRASGKLDWIRWEIRPWYEADGEIGGVILFSEVITERKQAEEAVRNSEEQLRLILDGLGPGIFVGLMDVEGTLLVANKPSLQAADLRTEDVIGKSFVDTYWWAYSDVVQQRLRSAIRRAAQGKPARYDELVRGAEGQHIWIDFSLHPLQDGNGNVIFIVPSANVITERKRAEEGLRQRAEQLAALNAIGRRVASRLSVEDIAQVALEEIAKSDSPDLAMFFTRQGDNLLLLKSLSPTDGLHHEETPVHRVGECLCGLAVGEGRPIYSLQVGADVRCAWKECKEAGVVSFAAIPLQAGKEALGVLGLASKTERDFSLNASFLETIADQIATGLQNARLLEDTRLSRDRLVELSKKLVEAREAEARAIGRELHDQIGQMLTALKLIMEVAPQLPPELREKKDAQAQELLDDLMNRVSRLSLELRPPMLDDLGLIPALLWHVNRFQEQAHIAVDFRHSGVEGKRFSPEIETTAYRVVQEAFTNVARHARAGRVRLEVQVASSPKGGSERMEIQIEDNGVGFDPQAALALNRGLGSMRERVQLVGGAVHIESQPGKGAKKFIQLPLRKKTT